MAITVQELKKLNSFQGFKQEAGEGGLDRVVAASGILDYECLPEYENQWSFVAGDFVLTNFVCAKEGDVDLVELFKKLIDSNAAGLAYKKVAFENLPNEVIELCNERNFPVFSFDTSVFIESITFEIMNTVSTEDITLLSEVNIKKMINGNIPLGQMLDIIRSLSLLFKRNVRITYIKGEKEEFVSNISRHIKNFELNKRLKSKSILATYEGGLMAFITLDSDSEESFDLVLKEICEYLFSDISGIFTYSGDIRSTKKEFAAATADAYKTYKASIAEQHYFKHYYETGLYRFLIPVATSENAEEFANTYLQELKAYPEFFETIDSYVSNGGDILKTAESQNVHQNTIRYRVNKIKELLSLTAFSDMEFYSIISTAIRIERLNRQ